MQADFFACLCGPVCSPAICQLQHTPHRMQDLQGGGRGISGLRQVIFSTDRIKALLTHSHVYVLAEALSSTILDTPAHSRRSGDLVLLPLACAQREIQLQQQE